MIFFPLLATLQLACAPDDVNDQAALDDTAADADTDSDTDSDSDSDSDADSDTDTRDGMDGNWVSEGADLSPLFGADPFNYVSIHASFATDLSFTVEATDQDGQSGTSRGTYVASDATTPGSITLTQTAPYSATASGIWQVEGSKLTYEVVQTDPDYGFTAPTPTSGFGSTGGDGLNPGDNIQVYRAE